MTRTRIALLALLPTLLHVAKIAAGEQSLATPASVPFDLVHLFSNLVTPWTIPFALVALAPLLPQLEQLARCETGR